MESSYRQKEKEKIRAGLCEFCTYHVRMKSVWSDGYSHFSPLINAVYKGHTQCCDHMVENGANVNERQHETKATALIYAAWRGNLFCCEVLHEAGAYLNAKTEWGSTALMFAAEKRYIQCVNFFVEKGAKVNIRNNYGETALIYAAICGRSSLSVQILLKARAKINICDVFGQNALENHLVENPFVNRQLAMLLLAAGEKLKGHKIYKYDIRGRAFATLLIPYFLRQHHQQFCLIHQCRKVIRQSLLEANPNEHLFNRVPLIGLPSILTSYLLFDVSIDTDYHNNDNYNYRRIITLLPHGTSVYATTGTTGFNEEEEDYSDDEYWGEDWAVNFHDGPFKNDSEEAEEEAESEVEEEEEAELDYSAEDEKDDGQCNQEEKNVNEKEETAKENAEFIGNKETVNQLENEKKEMGAEKLEDQDQFIDNVNRDAVWIEQGCGLRKSMEHGSESQENSVNKSEEGHHQPKHIQTADEMGRQGGNLTKPHEIQYRRIWSEAQAEEISMLKAMDENQERRNKYQEKAMWVGEWKHKEEVANEKIENGAITKITVALEEQVAGKG